jgi:hypothetical protein
MRSGVTDIWERGHLVRNERVARKLLASTWHYVPRGITLKMFNIQVCFLPHACQEALLIGASAARGSRAGCQRVYTCHRASRSLRTRCPRSQSRAQDVRRVAGPPAFPMETLIHEYEGIN